MRPFRSTIRDFCLSLLRRGSCPGAFRRPARAAAVVIAASLGIHGSTAATYDDNAAGDWRTPATWSVTGIPAGTDGYPIAGDNIIKNNDIEITLSADNQFGNSIAGSTWSSGSFRFTTNGVILEHVSGSTLNNSSGFRVGSSTVGVAGTFLNSGTFNHTGGTITLGHWMNGNGQADVFRNVGTYNMIGNLELKGESNRSVFENTGAINKTGGTGVGFIASDNGGFDNQGGTVTVSSGSLQIGAFAVGNNGAFGLPRGMVTSSGGTFTATNADNFIDFKSNLRSLTAATAGLGKVRINQNVRFYDNATIDMSGNGLYWTGGIINLLAGETLTNNGRIIYEAPAGTIRAIGSGGSSFINNGTFTVDSANNARPDFVINVTNNGVIEHIGNMASPTTISDIMIVRPGTTLTNSATGIIRKTGESGNARIESQGTFNNLGTVLSTAGKLQVVTTGITGFASNTISQGTWAAGGATGVVEIRDSTQGGNKIHTIGAGATVLLSEEGRFLNLEGTGGLSTVQGKLALHNDKAFTTVGDLSTPGRLEFGLNPWADTGGGVDSGTILNISGDATFTGGFVDIVDLGITEGTYRLITWTGTRTGELSLGFTPSNGLTYSLHTVDTTSGHVNLVVVPEPSALVFLLGGLGTLLLIRRRRRTA